MSFSLLTSGSPRQKQEFFSFIPLSLWTNKFLDIPLFPKAVGPRHKPPFGSEYMSPFVLLWSVTTAGSSDGEFPIRQLMKMHLRRVLMVKPRKRGGWYAQSFITNENDRMSLCLGHPLQKLGLCCYRKWLGNFHLFWGF